MGIVKLMLPRFIYYRSFLPSNSKWRGNAAMGAIQIFTLGNLLFFGMQRWSFRTPLIGQELVDPNKKYARSIPIL